MKKKLRKILGNRWIRWGVIPLLLFSLSPLVLFILTASSNFLVLSQFEYGAQFTPKLNGKEILSGKKLHTTIRAYSNNLGVVSVRFKTYNRINDDILVFRIKERGASKWFYQNEYKVDQFQDDKLFPFGFPPIEDSRGKVFLVEIESKQGRRNNAITLSSNQPLLETTYQYSRNKLLATNKRKLISYIFVKVMSTAKLIEYTSLSLLPLMYYLFWQLLSFKRSSRILVMLSFVSLLGYIFLIGRILPDERIESTPITVTLLGLWFLIAIKKKISSFFIFLFSVFFLFLSTIILLMLHRPDIAGRSAMFAYVFLMMGTILGIIQGVVRSQTIGITQFLNEAAGVRFTIDDVRKLLYTLARKIFTYLLGIFKALVGVRQQTFFGTIIFLIKRVAVLTIILFIFYGGVVVLNRLYVVFATQREIRSETPVISHIEPKIVYFATKVVVLGRGFGEKGDPNVKLFRNGEEVEETFWSSGKIIFNVPLSWNIGEHSLWIERTEDVRGKKTVLKSNAETIRIIDRADGWSQEDEEYFEQLKYLKEETLQLNGYTRGSR